MDWIKYYITNGKQFVALNQTSSSFGAVTVGSVLGTLLFLLYINDIIDNLGIIERIFADDISLQFAGNDFSSLENMINDDLKILHDWSQDWLVEFNHKKTKEFIISIVLMLKQTFYLMMRW